MEIKPHVKGETQPIKFGQRSDGQYEKAWWRLPKEHAAQVVASNIRYWLDHQTSRTRSFVQFARIYGNMPPNSLYGANESGSMQSAQEAGQFTYNATQSAIDTVQAHIGANKIRPDYAVTGGDYISSHQAELLNLFSDGIFDENDTYTKANDALKDAMIWGPGLIYVGAEHGRIVHRRALPMEIWVDESEAQYTQKVTQLHWTFQLDRERAIALWPKEKESLLEACQVQLLGEQEETMSDLIGVTYSWRLPSSPDKEDGAFLASCATHSGPVPLGKMEVWADDFFPFAILPYSKRPIGWWPQGAVEQVRGLQSELDFLHWVIQDTYHLINSVKLWYKTGTGISVDAINNDIGACLTSDEKPEWLITNMLIPPEILQRVQIIPEQILSQLGVSQLNATGQIPAELKSGEAQRVYANTGALRLNRFAQDYEKFCMDISKLSICQLPKALEQSGEKGYKVTVSNRDSLEVIDWSEIKIKDMDSFRVRCFPTSSLPTDLPGRIDTATELMQAGIITQDTFLEVLNMPDIQRVMTLQTSRQRWIVKCLDTIVNDGTYTDPEPFDRRDLALEIGLDYYARAKLAKVPERRLALIRQWIAAVTPPPPMTLSAPGGAPGGAPIAAPMPAPTSQILPFAPPR